ncbi:MAG: DUF5916 domain-containing protein, partial [Acidobacteriota bacterium]
MNARRATLVLCLAAGVAAQVFAAPAHYAIHATTDAIHVDGKLDEGVWQAPPTFTLNYETDPGDNIPAPVRTEVWITFDQGRLYAAVRAEDPEPAKIRARYSDRDTQAGDDSFVLVLDTFNDQRRAFEFFVNPFGVQTDATMNDVTGNEDTSWDAIWASAARITATGWEAEIAIPFSSLRFPRSSGPQTWGLDALRLYPRDRLHRLAEHALPRGRSCYLCHESKLEGFAGITPGRNLEFDPTLTANRTDSRPNDDLEQDYDHHAKVDPGLTVRWGVTPGMTLNAALNPDFSQVEADAAQLSVNTQFALFYPEKRPLFLEGADLFDTKINAVYTRDIADPSWGLKLTGKEGKNAMGVIVARDQSTNLLFPSSQGSSLGTLDQSNTSTVLRYRRDIAGTSAALGGLFTSREGDGYHNRVAGIDTLFNGDEHTLIRIEALGSNTLYPQSIRARFGQPGGELSGYALRAAWHRTTRDWTVHFDYNDVGPNFRADLGFIPQVDYRKAYAFAERNFYGDAGGAKHWYSQWVWGTETTGTYDSHGNPLQTQLSPYFYFNGPRQLFVTAYLGLGPSWYQGVRFDRTFVVWVSHIQAFPDLYAGLEGRIGQEIDYANTRQGNLVSLKP